MPTPALVEWIAYLDIEEQRAQQRMVEALSIVAAKLFAAKED